MTKVASSRNQVEGKIRLPRDRAATQIVDHLKEARKLPLVTIHGPSGVGKTDLAGPIIHQRLKVLSGKSTPKLVPVQIESDHSPEDLVLRITEEIIEHHSEFRSKKSSSVFREKFRRLVKRSPSDAAERLRLMMRATEKGAVDLKKIQLVISIDGLEKLFEDNVRIGVDLSEIAICGDREDPVGFLAKLIGMKTVLFTITYRGWVSGEVTRILENRGITEDRRYNLNLSYPNPEEAERIVTKMLVGSGAHGEGSKHLDQYGDTLVECIKNHPACIGMLPMIVESAFAEAEGLQSETAILDLLAKSADRAFLEQNTATKLALEVLFTKLIEGNGRLLLKDAAIARELWSAALLFVEHRVLAIDGRSYRKARIVVAHRDLLNVWKRAIHWSESDRVVGLSQLRNLDDKALSWELGDRNKALLLQSDQAIEDARIIMNDSELSSQLSPLTREYLNLSLKPKRDWKVITRKSLLPGLAGAFGITLISLLIIMLLPPDQDIPAGAHSSGSSSPSGQSSLAAAAPAKIPGNRDLLSAAELISDSKARIVETIALPDENSPATIKTAYQPPEIDIERDILAMLPPDSPPATLPSAQSILPQVEPGTETGEPMPLVQAKASEETMASTLIGLLSPIKRDREGRGPKAGRPGSTSGNEGGEISAESTWREIINAMGSALVAEDISTALDALSSFHEKTLSSPEAIGRLTHSEFKDLASHLGKAALVQEDKPAMQTAWRMELESHDGVAIDSDLRMLMARLALNDGREREAVAYTANVLSTGEIDASAVAFVRAAVAWHFDEDEKATRELRSLLPSKASAGPQ